MRLPFYYITTWKHLFLVICSDINDLLSKCFKDKHFQTNPAFTASTKHRQLKFSKLSSHTTFQQWGSTARRRQTLSIRSSTFSRDQISASCTQSFSAPKSAISILRGRPQQRQRSYTYSCHSNTCFRQAFSKCSTACKNTRMWGSQIWSNRKDWGCSRVSFKYRGNTIKAVIIPNLCCW